MTYRDPGQLAEPDGESFLLKLWIACGRERNTAIAIFVIVVGVAILVAAVTPREYLAEAKLLVKNDRAAVVLTPGSSVQDRADSDSDETAVNSELQIMKSEGLLEKVATQFLSSAPSSSGSSLKQQIAIEKAAERLASHLQIESIRKSNIISLSYMDRSPERAKDVLTSFLTDYQDLHLRAHATQGSYEFFRKQADDYKSQLTSVEGELSTLETTEHVFDLPQQEELITRQRESTQADFLAASASSYADASSIKNATRILTQTPTRIQTDSRSTPNQYAIERMRTTLLELQNRRTDLMTSLLPSDRQVQDLDHQIANTSNSLQQAELAVSVENVTSANPLWQSASGDVSRLRIQLSADEARRNALQDEVHQYDERLVHLATVEERYRELQRMQKELADSYNMYVQKREEASVSKALDESKLDNVSVVETPLAHHRPSRPKVWLDLLLGLALGTCLAVAGALLKDRRSHFRPGSQTVGSNSPIFRRSVEKSAL